MENWKFINANYEVSDKGNIKSVNYRGTGKSAIRKQSISKNGYMRVILSDNGKNKTYFVHRLVAAAFIPNPDNKQQVDHINGNLTDNRVCNLRWVTPKENSNNPVTVDKLKRILNNKPHYAAKGLAQYDLNGNLIKTYISFAEAKKSGFLRKGICKNLDGKTKNYNGFVWKRLL